jgi:hypothetical protein
MNTSNHMKSVKQQRGIVFSEQEVSRKDAKGAKTQRRVRSTLCVFAPFASLRETTPIAVETAE